MGYVADQVWENLAEGQAYGDSINVPGFNDIFHLRPKAKITEEELTEHRARRKRREPSNLSERQLEELDRRRERYKRMKQSHTPDLVRSISTVMTALDDVEDGLITFAVLGRLMVKLLPRLMGRFIPVIGWALLAADIINLFQILSWLPCSPTSAKRTKEDLTSRNPFGRVAKLKRAKKIARVVPTFGECLEVAQTTDQLFGVGVCLGSIVGMFVDAAAGLVHGIGSFLTSTQRSLAGDEALHVMRSSAIAFICQEDLTDEEHTKVILSQYIAQATQKPFLNSVNWFESAKEYSRVPIKPPAVRDPVTKYIFEDAGEDPEDTRRWPLAGNPEEVPLAEFVTKAFPKINDSLKGYIDRMKKTYEGYIASDCLHESLYDSLLIWEGHNPYTYDFYQRDSGETSITVNMPLGGKSYLNPTPSFAPEAVNSINKDVLTKTMTPHERITMQFLEFGLLPQPNHSNEQILNMIDRVARSEMYWDVKYTFKELYDTYVTHIGTPRRYFPVYPKHVSEGYLPHPDQWSEDFRRNMSMRTEVLWPNWDLVPKEVVDYYTAYGLL